jgi:myosin-1
LPNFAPSIEYNKKPGKPAVVKTQKDPNVPRDDVYKSGTIHTGQGEPPTSVSRPTPRGKSVARPITKGKLLRPGGPGGGPSKLASRPAQPRVTPASANQASRIETSRPVPQPLAALNGSAHARNSSSSSSRAPPPPPPPPPSAAPVSQDPMCRALYDFAGQSQGEMTVKKGDIVVIVRKETNGKPPPGFFPPDAPHLDQLTS